MCFVVPRPFREFEAVVTVQTKAVDELDQLGVRLKRRGRKEKAGKSHCGGLLKRKVSL